MSNFLKILLALFLFGSCSSNERKEQINMAQKPTTPIDDKQKIYVLIDSAINYGNENAYNKVASYYLIENKGESFFYYSFIMANKYKNPEAYFHLYDIIAHSTPKEPKEALNLMDNKTKNFALYNLLKSYELDFSSAKYQVEEIFGEGIKPPNSSIYFKEFTKE